MNAVLITFLVVMLVLLWRGFTSWLVVQKVLHTICGPLAVFVQWYTILFLAIGFLVVRTFYDIVVFEYLKYDFLKKIDNMSDPHFIPDLPDEEREKLMITPWLRIFSLGAPVAGFLAAFIVAQHAFRIVKCYAQRTAETWSRAPEAERSRRPLKWFLDRETSMVMLVIIMPIVFILMAMRAEVRMYAVMTGSAFLPYQHTSEDTLDQWEFTKTLELSVYTSDVEMCGFFAYITIFAFGRLCTSYLRDAPPEYQRALKYAGLQGVYLYVILGLLRSCANVAVAVGSSYPKYQFVAVAVQTKVLTFISPIFTAATVLCVYNMLVIGGMSDIKRRLGSANIKFQGVRFLVLVAQIQLMVLTALTVGSPIYITAQEKLPPKYFDMIFKNWHLSTYRAQLIHAAALNYECLFVAVFQRCVWRSTDIYGHSAHAREVAVDDVKGLGGMRERLLQSDSLEELSA